MIDDRREATNYYICDSIETARKLFEETVRENYFYGTPEEEKELKKQLENDAGGEWLYADDFVNFQQFTAFKPLAHRPKPMLAKP